MAGNSVSTLLIIIFVIIALWATLYIRNLLTRRAIPRVVKIFYECNALGIDKAKTLHELGLQRPDLLQRMMKPRDYKQYALQILIRRGIIQVNADGRLYLVEEKLDQSFRDTSDIMLKKGA